jgi:ABC-type nitrate/sulfonate/bicarbonate transport system substrate-binding protein
VVVLILVFGASAAACGDDDTATTTSTSTIASSTTGSDLVQVKFVPDWNNSWVGWIPWVGALEKGWFEEAGIDLQVVLPPTGSDPPKFIGTGTVDLGYTIGADLLFAASQGLDFKVISGLSDQIPQGIGCWADEVTVPQDLYGKTVAVYDFPSSGLFWGFFVDFHDLDLDQITVVSEGQNTTPLIVSGAVDCIDAAASGELVQMQQEAGREATYFIYDNSNGIPKLQNSLLAVYPPFAEANPEVVEAFIATWFRAVDHMFESQANTDEFIDIFVAAYPENNREATVLGWEAMGTYAYPRYFPEKPEGYVSAELLANLAAILAEAGMLERPLDDAASYVTNEYVPGCNGTVDC